MHLSLDTNGTSTLVRAYEKGFIRVNDQTLIASFIISLDTIVPGWEPQSMDQLTAQHIEQLLDSNPEVLLLGTGALLQFPPPDILAISYQAGIGIEVMDTASACRTFNILSSEGRKVTAGMMMI